MAPEKRLVLIEWLDAAGPDHTNWTEMKDLDDKIVLVRTVGWLVTDNDERVAAIQSFYDTEKDGRWFSSEMKIPRGCIKRMVDLVEAPPLKSAGGRSGRSSRKGGSSRGTGR